MEERIFNEMQTNEPKTESSLNEQPILNVSTTQADYGSTTATENVTALLASFDRNQSSSPATDATIDDRAASAPSSSKHQISSDSGFGYQTLASDSRYPSFVNIPTSATGRFRFHPSMESGGRGGGGGKAPYPASTSTKSVEFFLNVCNHTLIGFVTIYMSWLCLRVGLADTALHAWLVTIGFSFLMAEGIMCHYSGNVLTSNLDRDTKTKAHWILQAIGGGLGVIGASIKLFQKGFILQSTHSKLGFTTVIFSLVNMLSGVSALYSIRLKRLLSPLLNKTVHNLLGFVTFFIAMLAQFYGYSTGFFMKKTESDFQNLMKCITILSLALTSIGPLKSFLRKTQTIYKQYVQ